MNFWQGWRENTFLKESEEEVGLLEVAGGIVCLVILLLMCLAFVAFCAGMSPAI